MLNFEKWLRDPRKIGYAIKGLPPLKEVAYAIKGFHPLIIPEQGAALHPIHSHLPSTAAAGECPQLVSSELQKQE